MNNGQRIRNKEINIPVWCSVVTRRTLVLEAKSVARRGLRCTGFIQRIGMDICNVQKTTVEPPGDRF
jgi:hypothetical protein